MHRFRDLMLSEEHPDLALQEANLAALNRQRSTLFANADGERAQYLALAEMHQQRSLYFTPTQGTA